MLGIFVHSRIDAYMPCNANSDDGTYGLSPPVDGLDRRAESVLISSSSWIP
jgi:hypothetical protein